MRGLMKFGGRGSAGSLKSVVATMILTAGIGIPFATQAARCDYCGTGGGGEWQCHTAYTNAGGGAYVAQGTFCTFFAYTNVGGDPNWNPVDDALDGQLHGGPLPPLPGTRCVSSALRRATARIRATSSRKLNGFVT